MQYATLGPYAANSLFNCNPTIREGNILDITNIKYHDSLKDFPTRITYARVWDLGHKDKKGSKKAQKSDPTGGTLLGFRKIGMNTELKIPIVELWVKDYKEFMEKSPKRDRMITDTIYTDGPEVECVMESTADSMDAVNQLITKLKAVKIIRKINVTKSKTIRIAPMEAVFAIGNVHILKAGWNDRWIEGIQEFDGSDSVHDEMVDNISTGYEYLVWKGRMPRSVRW